MVAKRRRSLSPVEILGQPRHSLPAGLPGQAWVIRNNIRVPYRILGFGWALRGAGEEGATRSDHNPAPLIVHPIKLIKRLAAFCH